MINKTGIARLQDTNLSRGNDASQISQLADSFFIARVVDINLNSDSKLFDRAGGYSGIGFIQYEKYTQAVNPINKSKPGPSLAKPLFPHHKSLPLVNEYVLIFRGPSPDKAQQTNNTNFYYLNPMGIWNTPHFNAYPDTYNDPNDVTPSMNKTIRDILLGNIQKPNKKTSQISPNGNSGGTFSEKGNIHPILPFAGDVILEGRFGNSVRLGSTAKSRGEITNNWSEGSDNGNPLVIIKNGQPESASSEGYIPIVEDINVDPSSIYLTTNQKIPFIISTVPKREGEGTVIPFSSVIKKTPISPQSFNKPQAIINSGRILFNSNIDSILLSSQKSIILESVDEIGIKSRDKNVNVIAPKGIVSLGATSQEAQNSVILGDLFMTQFKVIVESFINLAKSISNEPKLSEAAAQAKVLVPLIEEVEKQIPTLTSQKVKVS